ncbi:MAG: LytTR family DNA-binding domain-containing protein [Ferruginibacter sp.]
MLTAFLVDDDISCIQTLETLLEAYCPGVSIAGKATSIAEAVAGIQRTKPQVVFLDVEVGQELGFDLFQQFPQPDFKVIFTTGHREYALQAIKSSCLDFLVKPVDFTELKEAVQKAEQYFKQTEQQQQIEVLLSQFASKNTNPRIAINTPEGYEFVNKEDILYCEASLNYTHVYLPGGKKLLAARSLGDFEEVLPKEQFFRCHKSFLINLQHIQKVSKTDGLQAKMSNEKWVDISVRKKEEFLKRFERF